MIREVAVSEYHAGEGRDGTEPVSVEVGYPHAGHGRDPGQLELISEELLDYAVAEDVALLAWLLARSQPGIIPIPGASTVAQLDEILGATGLSLDEETIRRLDQAGSSDLVEAAV